MYWQRQWEQRRKGGTDSQVSVTRSLTQLIGKSQSPTDWSTSYIDLGRNNGWNWLSLDVKQRSDTSRSFSKLKELYLMRAWKEHSPRMLGFFSLSRQGSLPRSAEQGVAMCHLGKCVISEGLWFRMGRIFCLYIVRQPHSFVQRPLEYCWVGGTQSLWPLCK